jgi:hypothetical protein
LYQASSYIILYFLTITAKRTVKSVFFLAYPCSICKYSIAFQVTLRLAPGIAISGADWQNTSDSGIWYSSTHSGSLLNTKLSGADITFTSGAWHNKSVLQNKTDLVVMAYHTSWCNTKSDSGVWCWGGALVREVSHMFISDAFRNSSVPRHLKKQKQFLLVF